MTDGQSWACGEYYQTTNINAPQSAGAEGEEMANKKSSEPRLVSESYKTLIEVPRMYDLDGRTWCTLRDSEFGDRNMAMAFFERSLDEHPNAMRFVESSEFDDGTVFNMDEIKVEAAPGRERTIVER